MTGRRRGDAEYRRLSAAWDRALDEKDRTGSRADEDAEQEAYTALCDYVEENGLNGTTLDPRGTWAEHDARSEA